MTSPHRSHERLADCPLCYLAAITQKTADGHCHVRCDRCGTYGITDTAKALCERLPSRILVALSYATWIRDKDGQPVTIGMQNIAQLIAPYL